MEHESTYFLSCKSVRFIRTKEPNTIYKRYGPFSWSIIQQTSYLRSPARNVNELAKDKGLHWRKWKNVITFNAEVNPSSQTAFENLFGSAPPLVGSNLLFTSAIKSQPL